AAPPDLRFGLFYLAQVNLVIGIFNLLPAFPMDGGRIFRSLLQPRLGRVRATTLAATVGKVVAVGLVVWGILGAGFWLVLIGLFIFLGGEAESRSLQSRAALRGLRVADCYVRRVATTELRATALDAAQAMLAARTEVCFVLSQGEIVGRVAAED